MYNTRELDYDGKKFSITNLDKIFWPGESYTKGDLLDYYEEIAPYILPYLQKCPLVLHRRPDGITGKSFYQKECPEYAPEWLPRVSLPASNGKKMINYCLVHDTAGLLWLVNQGCIEIHPWLSTYEHPDYPLELVLDLDPNPPADFKMVVTVTKLIHQVLEVYNLKGYVKTSRASGLHIYILVEPRYTFAEVRRAALLILEPVEQAYPAGVTLERKLKARGGRVYLDYMHMV